jgi:hypothetical protein
VSSNQGATVAEAPDRRATTVTPSDREVTAAVPLDLGSTIGRTTGGRRRLALLWNRRRRRARLGGRPTLMHRSGESKTELWWPGALFIDIGIWFGLIGWQH